MYNVKNQIINVTTYVKFETVSNHIDTIKNAKILIEKLKSNIHKMQIFSNIYVPVNN